MIKRVLPSCCLVLILCSTSCAVDKKVVVDEVFEIPLEDHGQGGFQWTYNDLKEVIVVDSFETNTENSTGFSTYTKHYKLKGIKKGTYTLEFLKVRSFQPDLILDENIKKIKVRIKKAQ
ncbi:MAG: protease inhibitor I42 family protein [Bacteroidota bacterium]